MKNPAIQSRLFQLLLIGLLGLFLAPAAAEDTPLVLPPSAEPDPRLEQLPRPQPTTPGAEVVIPQGPLSQAPSGAERIRFVLKGLGIEGVTAYSPEVMQEYIAGKIGQEIALSEIYDIAAAIQTRYREDGYFLSRALVPPQTIQGGKVQMLVLEGHVSALRFEGDVGPVKQRIEAYLSNILDERPLTIATLEHWLLLAKDLPGVDVRGVLRPKEDELGAAELVVEMQRKAISGMALVDNIGSTFTGEWEIAGSVAANSFTRYGENLRLTALVSDPGKGIGQDTENQKVLQLASSMRVGKRGAWLDGLLSYGDSNPGALLSLFDFDSTKFLASVGGGYPLKRSRDRSVYVEGGFDWIDSDTDVFNGAPFSRDRLRVLRLGARTDFRDRFRGANLASIGIRQGLGILGASEEGDPLNSRAQGSGQFTLLHGEFIRLQPLWGALAFYGRLGAQYSFDDLLSDEEFSLGGTEFGRGYDPKELSGDDGYGFTGELQFTKPVKMPWMQRYQAFGFYDGGQVYKKSIDQSASLASAGAGVRLFFARELSLEMQVAKPLTRRSQRADFTKDPEFLMRAIALF